MVIDINVNRGKFILVNENSGNVCCVESCRGRLNASRSTCYRIKRDLSRRFPECAYRVYKLVGLGK